MYGQPGGFGGGAMYPGGMMGAPPPQAPPPPADGAGGGYPPYGGGGGAPQMGPNGLYMAPPPDGPPPHEAQQYMRLNVAEDLKYSELWNEASPDGKPIGGAAAVGFLSRASRVSRSQLRLIWSIADHTKAGALDRDTFFIALRLVALGQRGADISVNGLRSFAGLHLVPDIGPPPAPAAPKEQPPSASPGGGAGGGAPGGGSGFSWTIEPAEAEKYDAFFANLDAKRTGYVTGAVAGPFFGSSGLPRPVLKRVWQLADVRHDGRLDRSQFRVGIHLVTGLRTHRLAVEALPPALDPEGTLWVRVRGEEPPPRAPAAVVPPQGGAAGSTPSLLDGGSLLDGPGLGPTTPRGGPPMGGVDLLGMGGGGGGGGAGNGAEARASWQENPEALREDLRATKMEAARAKQQLEAMQAQMQALQLAMQQQQQQGGRAPSSQPPPPAGPSSPRGAVSADLFGGGDDTATLGGGGMGGSMMGGSGVSGGGGGMGGGQMGGGSAGAPRAPAPAGAAAPPKAAAKGGGGMDDWAF